MTHTSLPVCVITLIFFFFFFFQAEDGIRDYKVTGVQTCALPILPRVAARVLSRRARQPAADPVARRGPRVVRNPRGGLGRAPHRPWPSLGVGVRAGRRRVTTGRGGRDGVPAATADAAARGDSARGREHGERRR